MSIVTHIIPEVDCSPAASNLISAFIAFGPVRLRKTIANYVFGVRAWHICTISLDSHDVEIDASQAAET